jgi:hypothetical protein
MTRGTVLIVVFRNFIIILIIKCDEVVRKLIPFEWGGAAFRIVLAQSWSSCRM